jgi:hypothetical protein
VVTILKAPKYIEIRDSEGNLRAYLSPESDFVKDCYINNRLNEECTLEFLLPLTSNKWQELNAECRIIADDREFIILKPDCIETQRDDQGRLWGKVMAVESWALLNKEYVTVSNDPMMEEVPEFAVVIVSGGPSTGGYPQGSAGSALTYLLQESEWELDTCDVVGTYDLETEKESLLANIKEVQRLWGGYLVWDSINKKLSLRSETTWQDYSGFQVRYAKNLKHITKTTNYDLVTRLYPFGENELDISSVNDGVKYVENFSYTDKIYVGVYQDQSIYDPQSLKDKAIEVLEKLSRPRYTYHVRIADLRTLPEYSHEDFKIGDLVDVIDEELETNVRARIERHKYNVFMPWQCELDIGEPEERLAARLADTLNVARFVRDVLKPNRATSNLLKGFISTFATRINSANGKLVWDDATLQAIEIDGEGNETGNRVRITPGGIGISTDGGQTYVTAMTGQGILANTIIVNELYALATDDGYTKLTASGLHVYDENWAERLVAGWWMDGATKRFGLNVKAQDGATTLLDDRGLLQTWQEGRADNVQNNYPLVLNVYLPPETRSIRRALLRFRRQNFRAYSTGAASGGGHVTPSAGAHRHRVFEWTGGGIWEDVMYTNTRVAGSHDHPSAGSHQHEGAGSHDHGGTTYGGPGNHQHVIYAHGYHQHPATGSHSHGSAGSHSHQQVVPLMRTWDCQDVNGRWQNIGIGSPATNISDIWTYEAAGTHTHTVNDHTHPISYGIYISTLPTSITVKINGVDRTSALGGPFNSDQANLDISSYLVIGQWNTIELGSSQLGRIDATIFIQALMGL